MKRLKNDIKKFKGNTVCIGVNDTNIMNTLKKNSNISIYELTRNSKRRIFKNKKRFKMNNKSVSIKKYRKLFKKKAINYLIIDLNNIYDYFKYIVSNSIYICSNKVYIYGHSDFITATDIARKYKRYKTTIEPLQEKDNFLVIIDCSKAKYSKIKEKFYIIIDTFYNLGDMISYFLTS